MKQEIIAKFLQKQKLLTSQALEFLENKDLEQFLQKDYDDLVLDVKDFLKPEEKEIKIWMNLTQKPKEISKQDFIRFYTSKYERMKNIILSRIKKDFISLNKLDSLRNEVFVVGIVKDIKEKNEKNVVELEDFTCSKSVIFDGAIDMSLDDVIAISAISAGNVLYGKSILYPDIPLRSPTKGSGKACFISDLHFKEAPTEDIEKFFSWFEKQDIPYLFMAGDIESNQQLEKMIDFYGANKTIITIPGEVDSDKEYPQLPEKFNRKNIIPLSNPAMIEINGIKILIIHYFEQEMLRKRYLGKSDVVLPEDFLALEQVPDIVHYGHTHKPHTMNYKSITIVNSGSPLAEFKPVVIDFETRDVQQVTLE